MDRAALLAGYLEAQPADLVISGVQSADDLEGQLPPMLAALLDWPHVSVAVSVGVEAPWPSFARSLPAAGRMSCRCTCLP